MRRFSLSLLSLCFLLVSVSFAQQTSTTAIPNLIRYSGTLKDAQGAALSSSTAVGVTFSIYKQQDGGAPVWMETQNVTPDASGQYSVVLGSTTATGLPDDLFSQQEQRWLGVQVQGQAEQARVLLVSVPYAFKAHEAETLGGLPASAFVKAPVTDATGSASKDAGTAVNALNTAASGKTKRPLRPLSTTPGFITKFTASPPTVEDSLMSELNAGRVDVNGNFNLLSIAGAYQIGASTVLSILGTNNLFAGVGAGSSNTGAQNTFVGANAGNRNVGGNYNTFIGEEAGWLKNQGDQNSFTGYRAGYRNFDGKFNAFFGSEAGHYNNGSNNVFVGYGADFGPLAFAGNTGDNNTIVGFEGGFRNTANNNSFYGYQAGYSNTTSTGNAFFGYQAGYSQTTGEFGVGRNTFLGFQAGYSNSGLTGTDNTFVGYGAGFYNTDGSSNTYIGLQAGFRAMGLNNTFLGVGAGGNNGYGFENVFLGYNAGGANYGAENIFIGFGAGSNNTTGFDDIYIGNHGCAYLCIENNTIRIGNEDTSIPPPYHFATYIAGIYDKTVDRNTAQVVFIDSTGKLGTVQLLLSNLQRQDLLAAAQQDVIKSQEEQIKIQGQQIADLQQRLSRLESLIARK